MITISVILLLSFLTAKGLVLYTEKKIKQIELENEELRKEINILNLDIRKRLIKSCGGK